MQIRSSRDLIVWQKAMSLVTSVYRLTERLPASERYGLAAQLRRSAVSIPANLAEGRSRHGHAEYRRFVSIACGSLAEIETHLEIGMRLEFLDPQSVSEIQALADEVGRMLTTLHKRLGAPP